MNQPDFETKLRQTHQPAEVVHQDEREWEVLRWPGQHSKMLFHPCAERPTEPNAGLVRYEPGAHHPFHAHDFAQVWYILEGEFRIGDGSYGPGTMLFYPDPHYEEPLRPRERQVRGRSPQAGVRHLLRAARLPA